MTTAYLQTPDMHTIMLTNEGGVPSIVADNGLGNPCIYPMTCLSDFVVLEQTLQEMKDAWLRKNCVPRS